MERLQHQETKQLLVDETHKLYLLETQFHTLQRQLNREQNTFERALVYSIVHLELLISIFAVLFALPCHLFVISTYFCSFNFKCTANSFQYGGVQKLPFSPPPPPPLMYTGLVY